MGYTVTHQGDGGKWDEYLGVLSHQGADLARAARCPDPVFGQRWVHVWDQRPPAQEFARELQRRTRDQQWVVQVVSGPTATGPLGPLELQLVGRWAGFTFWLPVVSRILLGSLFPERPNLELVTLRGEGFFDGQTGEDRLRPLVEPVVRVLTGLAPDQLHVLGYRITSAETGKEVWTCPPSELIQGAAGRDRSGGKMSRAL